MRTTLHPSPFSAWPGRLEKRAKSQAKLAARPALAAEVPSELAEFGSFAINPPILGSAFSRVLACPRAGRQQTGQHTAVTAVFRLLSGARVIRPSALVSKNGRLLSTGHAAHGYGLTRTREKYWSTATVPMGGRTKLGNTSSLRFVTVVELNTRHTQCSSHSRPPPPPPSWEKARR